MRLSFGIAFLLSLLALSCNEPTETDQAAGTEPDAAAAPADEEAAPPAEAAPEASADQETIALDCDALVPAELREKHQLTPAEVQIVDEPAPTASCRFTKDSEQVAVLFVCPDWSESTFRQTMENAREHMQDCRDIEDMGRMAFVGNMAGLSSLQFWDDDTPCYATLTIQDADLGIALARDLVGSLNPEAIAK